MQWEVKRSHRRHKESICRLFGVLKLTIAPGCPEVMESLTSAVNFIQCWKKKNPKNNIWGIQAVSEGCQPVWILQALSLKSCLYQQQEQCRCRTPSHTNEHQCQVAVSRCNSRNHHIRRISGLSDGTPNSPTALIIDAISRRKKLGTDLRAASHFSWGTGGLSGSRVVLSQTTLKLLLRKIQRSKIKQEYFEASFFL